MSVGPHIPERFANTVDKHLAFNHAGVPAWPLVLGIFGRPGDGKTYQLRTHLDRRSVMAISINAADLESDRAGQPGKMVLAMYEDAGHRTSEGTPAALLIDDFDTTVGEWEHSTTTVNHQQVLAQIMHLADSPAQAGSKPLRRVPVFFTGNDLSKVYPPLRRPGRMRSFPWLPSQAERQAIVAHVLTDVLKPGDVMDLLTTLPDAPIAFFSDLLVEITALAAETEVLKQARGLKAVAKDPHAARERIETQLKFNKISSQSINELALEIWEQNSQAARSNLLG